jgi:hypothetical protein
MTAAELIGDLELACASGGGASPAALESPQKIVIIDKHLLFFAHRATA